MTANALGAATFAAQPRDLKREAWADMAQVARIYAQMGEAAPKGLYGPFVGSPEDAKHARIEREDDTAWWNAVLASPDVNQED